MLSLSIVSIHPAFIDSYRNFGVLKAAEVKSLAEIKVINLRNYGLDRHGTIDDRPYGGGDGMVMRPEPLAQVVKDLGRPLVIASSPAGKRWTQAEAQSLATSSKPLCFICGRFGGMDQRFIDRYVDAEYSLGDFVIAGGELAVLTMVDSILRLIPGVLGHEESAHVDSFGPGLDGLLEHPLYTRPLCFEGEEVPAILRSGDHKQIAAWRREQALARTRKLRPDLLES